MSQPNPLLRYPNWAYKNRKISIPSSEGGRGEGSYRLGQCPKFSQFLIWEASLNQIDSFANIFLMYFQKLTLLHSFHVQNVIIYHIKNQVMVRNGSKTIFGFKIKNSTFLFLSFFLFFQILKTCVKKIYKVIPVNYECSISKCSCITEIFSIAGGLSVSYILRNKQILFNT